MTEAMTDAYAHMYAILTAAHEDPDQTVTLLDEVAELIVSRQLETERLDMAARAAAARVTDNATLALSTLMHAVRLAAAKLAVSTPGSVAVEAAKVVAAAKLLTALQVASTKLAQEASDAAELVKATAELAAEALAVRANA
jgi:hypothetical protein